MSSNVRESCIHKYFGVKSTSALQCAKRGCGDEGYTGIQFSMIFQNPFCSQIIIQQVEFIWNQAPLYGRLLWHHQLVIGVQREPTADYSELDKSRECRDDHLSWNMAAASFTWCSECVTQYFTTHTLIQSISGWGEHQEIALPSLSPKWHLLERG